MILTIEGRVNNKKKMDKATKSFSENLGEDIYLEMIYIPAGTFMMFSKNANDCGKPVHKVTLKHFYLGKYQLTQAQYQTVTGKNPSSYQGKNNPVEKVSWYDAQEFCAELSKKTGKKYRLPSETQWEYAARAGSATKYYFGDNENQLKQYAWYDDNSKNKTHPVGQKKPNQWGLYDMHGNVWEWCQDDYLNDYQINDHQNAPKDGSPFINRDSKHKVLRGGSFYDYSDECRSAAYDFCNPRYDFCDRFGFRVMRIII